ncbi:MAG: bifunctional hydroxymethylpyrimidine kinase/phosphomethylpyrimidine kinase [Methanomassiliicoccales archaeon]|nr:bifunctional hydroxymethylpyrimidine kinase/phosphomethylpyrimidine kinase [Methanomassiliicoccales archaeon]
MVVVLTVAGSDSVGGAGIEADLKAIASMGGHGSVALTAVTAQNTSRVREIFPLPPEQVIAQINAVVEDAKPSAIKTGMLYSSRTVKAVAPLLGELKVPLVVDPVLFAGVGAALHREGLVKALIKDLFLFATVITPNKGEAEALSGMTISDDDTLDQVGHRLLELGPQAVLIKGGHLGGTMAVDTLFTADGAIEMASPRLDRKVHGAGCTLSSYIACGLALGMGPDEAVKEAKRRIYDAIAMSLPVGQGLDCINPMASLYKEAMKVMVLESVRSAVRSIEERLPPELVPEVGMNLACALPYPQGYLEVCGVEGRIVRIGDRVSRAGEVRFGGSRHIARVVMSALAVDPEMRCAMNVRFSEERVAELREAGLSVGSFDRAEEPDMVSSMEWGTAEAIKVTGHVPDVIFDRGGRGKEPMIRLLGRNPEEVLFKLEHLIK